MRKTQQGIRTVLVYILALVLFGCSSKEKKIEEPVQPSQSTAAQVATTPPVAESELQLVHFAYNSYQLSREAKQALRYNAAWLKQHPTEKMEVQGHCDERGSMKYNTKLGDKRARAAKNYLVKLGIKGSRLKVVSYGFDRPLDPGHDEEAWAKNRRAAFVSSN